VQPKTPRFAQAGQALLSPDPGSLIRRETEASRPLYFGPPERPLFGWLHIPESAHHAPVGLVICNPFGNEGVCAHRSLRHFAQAACRAGFVVLRFDYDGTGDSTGHDQEPERVAAWLDSIHAAAEELKRAAAIQRLCLLGVRLGATLAARAAAERDDIEALIAIAPVVSGKAYVRELKLLSRAIDAKRSVARAASDGSLEAAGFVLSAETQASLSTLDLNRLERLPAPRVLVLDRAEMPSDAAWTEKLTERGARVDRKSVTGYTEMMLDSHETVVPEEMIQTTCRWLSELPRQAITATGEDPSVAPTGITLLPEETPDPVTGPGPGVDVWEEAVRFGRPTPLFGIITTPAPFTAGQRSTKAVLLLNAGAVHRIGPNRLYVALARHLARHGYTVLRMDVAGIGDSPPRADAPENVVYSRHALEDVRLALDYLRLHWDVTEVYAAGLCSGAYNAFKAAVANLPLTGAILINPLTFFWKEGMTLQYTEYTEHRVAHDMQRYRTNAFRLSSWLKLLRGEVNLRELSQVLARHTRTIVLGPPRALARSLGFRLHDDLPTELQSIVRSGVQLQFIFADHDPGHELLNKLGGTTARRLRARGLIGVTTIEDADHTFTDQAARRMLVSALGKSLLNPSPQ
jgi:alpha-beta hydrolase superfamily lysophospholipase